MKFVKAADKMHSKLLKEEVNGETIYYRKRQVYPALAEDGSVNWFNTLTGGSWKHLAIALLITIISLGFIWEYHNNLEYCSEILSQLNINISLTDQPIYSDEFGLGLTDNGDNPFSNDAIQTNGS